MNLDLLQTIERIYPTLIVRTNACQQGYDFAVVTQIDDSAIPTDVVRHIMWMAAGESTWLICGAEWTHVDEAIHVYHLELVKAGRREGVRTITS